MNNEILEKIEKVYDLFPGSFIYKDDELILEKKLNLYFRLPDLNKAVEFDYKLLSYCSFYTATNHFKPTSKSSKYFLDRINRWFRTDFNIEQMQKIYQKIGTGCNKPLGIKFIESGFNFGLLNE